MKSVEDYQDLENQLIKQIFDKGIKVPSNPFDRLNIFSRILFFWINPLLKKSQKQELTQDDIFQLRKKDSSQYNFEIFDKVYEELKNDPKVTNKIRSTFYRIYKKEIIIVVVLYCLNLSANLLNMISAQELLKAFASPDKGLSFKPLLPGFIYLFLTFLFLSIIQSNYNFYYSLLNVRMTGALSMTIFKKMYVYPIFRNQIYKIGDILNMIQVDILQNVFMVIFIIPLMAVSFYLCYQLVQNTTIIFIMLLVVVIFFVISLLFGKLYGSIQKKFMHQKDLRMRSLEEMMRGIKTIKYNNLENFFDERVFQKRQKEIKKLRSQNFLLCFNNFISNISSTVFVFIISQIYGFQSLNEFLMMNQAYQIILGFIIVLPLSIKGIVVGMNSMQRVDNFLVESFIYKPDENINNLEIDENQNSDYALVLNNASFQWKNNIDITHLENSHTFSKKERRSLTAQSTDSIFSIQDLNLKIQKGEYVVFYGELGSGKSSLLQGILGEMEVLGGENEFKKMVQINGTISLCTQEPWIIQDTVKENIVFGQNYCSLRYKQSLFATCLEEDISCFVDGDSTNIGEKGETLSGGQRKRVNLARSIYKDSDIYMLDDPLSALDIGVATHIVKECFEGLLKSKTRIIFTNNLLGMENADRIYIVKNGQIINQGRYNQIKKIIAEGENKQYDQQAEILDYQKERYQSEKILNKNNSKLENETKKETDYTNKLIKAEDIQQGYIKLDVYKEYFSNMGGIYFIIITIIILGGFTTSGLLSRVMMLKVQEGTSESEQYNIMMLYSLYDVIRVISIFLYESFFVFKMISLSKYLHKWIVYTLLRGSFTKFYNLITTGRLMNRLSKDIYEIDIYLQKDLANLMSQLGNMLTSLVFCILISSLKVYPIVIAFLIISIFLAYYFLKAKRQLVRIEATSKSPILQYFSEMIRGIFYLRNCIQYDNIKDTFQQYVDIDLRNQIAVNGTQYWFECVTTFISMFPILIACVIMVIRFDKNKYYDNDTSPNLAVLITVSISNLSTSFIYFSVNWISFETHLINFERCFRLKQSIILENDEQKQILSRQSSDSDDEIEDINSQDDQISEEKQNKINIIQNQTSIHFRNASFQYRADIPNCLTNINIKMSGNQKIGIVGRTGAGKTSITLALTKVIDLVEGDVFINKKSISSYSLNSLRETISVVSQEPYIYEGTLKTNLDPYNHYSHQSIAEVYTKCGFNSCYSFKQGLDTEISQLGDNLSEGEKQLISIARIILKNSKIVIVDEPTSNIDIQMEEQDCLMITIAHKIKTIMSSDKILVLDHGKVQEYDTPQKLLSDQNSLFSGIINMINKHTIN